MKLFVILSAFVLKSTLAFADINRARQEISSAQVDIQAVINLVPYQVRPNLDRALQRLNNALSALDNGDSSSERHYCLLSTKFGGSFSGRGRTETEARSQALKACVAGANGSSFWCDKGTWSCEQE